MTDLLPETSPSPRTAEDADWARIPAPTTSVAVIESIATSAPNQTMDQAASAGEVAALFADPVHRRRVARIFEKTQIARRHLAVDPLDPEFREFSLRPDTIRQRGDLFYDLAVPLAVDAARRAVAGLTNPADSIGTVIFATSTGFLAPGVDVAVLRALELPPTVHRVVINFMGCAAAVNVIRTASDYVRANPDHKALVICLEVSSANAVFAEDVNDLVIHSLFGDGCGAALIGAAVPQHPLVPGSIVVRDSFSHLLDDAEDGIVLRVNSNGITCLLAEDLPLYIRRGVDAALAPVLERNGLTKQDIELWAIHPGGPKIINESARSLGIDPMLPVRSWEVLAEYGNMLSVSLLFVLRSMLDNRDGSGEISTGIAFSFAPGVTLEGMLFDVVRG